MDPTPGELMELRQRLLDLADAITSFNQRAVNVPLRFDHPESTQAIDLLSDVLNLAHYLGGWDSQEGPISDFAWVGEPLFLQWDEWPDGAVEEAWWTENVVDAFRNIVEALSRAGLPFDPQQYPYSIQFQDLRRPSINAFRRSKGKDGYLSQSEWQTQTPIASIRDGAILRQIRGEGRDRDLATDLILVADEILGTVQQAMGRHSEDGRLLCIDPLRVPETQRGYSHVRTFENVYPTAVLSCEPFETAIKLEAMCGIKLVSPGDPAWLVEQHGIWKRSGFLSDVRPTFSSFLLDQYPDFVTRNECIDDANETLFDLEYVQLAEDLDCQDASLSQFGIVKSEPPNVLAEIKTQVDTDPCVDQFMVQLDHYESVNLDADDDASGSQEPVDDFETITKTHPLDIAATKLAAKLGRKNLPNSPPFRAGRTYRELIAVSGGMTPATMKRNGIDAKVKGDWDECERCLDVLREWVRVELAGNETTSSNRISSAQDGQPALPRIRLAKVADRLLRSVWSLAEWDGNVGRSLARSVVYEVWRDEEKESTALRPAISRLNNQCLEQRIPLEMRTSGDWIEVQYERSE